MKSILICSDVPAAAEKILSVLSGSGYAAHTKSDPVSACGDGAEENIVLFVLSSVHGWEDAARYFSKQTTAGLLALVREGAREEAERRFAGLGIPVLGISLSCKALLTVLKFAEKSADALKVLSSTMSICDFTAIFWASSPAAKGFARANGKSGAEIFTRVFDGAEIAFLPRS